MPRIIAILILFASGCSLNKTDLTTSDEKYCQKTTTGKEVCVREENTSCRKEDYLFFNPDPFKDVTGSVKVICNANGVITDLASKKEHWSSSDNLCYLPPYEVRNDGTDYAERTKYAKEHHLNLACNAAGYWGKISNAITHNENMVIALSNVKYANENETVYICPVGPIAIFPPITLALDIENKTINNLSDRFAIPHKNNRVFWENGTFEWKFWRGPGREVTRSYTFDVNSKQITQIDKDSSSKKMLDKTKFKCFWINEITRPRGFYMP